MKLIAASLVASMLFSTCVGLPTSREFDEGGVPYERVVTYNIHPDFKKRAYAIQDSILTDHVLHDYLGRFFPPGELFVEYPYGSGFPVEYGNYIDAMYSIEFPSISYEAFFPYSEAFSKDYYLLAITDIAPNGQQTAKAVWINLIIRKKDVTIKQEPKKSDPNVSIDYFSFDLDPKDDKALVPFLTTAPAVDTGEHRFVFMLFRQSLGTIPYHRLKQRLNWGTNITGHGIQEWANYYSLKPIGVNYFNSSNDDQI